MKVIYKLSDLLTFEIESENQKELFKELSTVGEVFGEHECGKCHSKNIRFQVRNVESNDFYEYKCNACGATLAFGCHKKGGTLFPKRKDDTGKYLDNKGWSKWVPAAKD